MKSPHCFERILESNHTVPFSYLYKDKFWTQTVDPKALLLMVISSIILPVLSMALELLLWPSEIWSHINSTKECHRAPNHPYSARNELCLSDVCSICLLEQISARFLISEVRLSLGLATAHAAGAAKGFCPRIHTPITESLWIFMVWQLILRIHSGFHTEIKWCSCLVQSFLVILYWLEGGVLLFCLWHPFPKSRGSWKTRNLLSSTTSPTPSGTMRSSSATPQCRRSSEDFLKLAEHWLR